MSIVSLEKGMSTLFFVWKNGVGTADFEGLMFLILIIKKEVEPGWKQAKNVVNTIKKVYN